MRDRAPPARAQTIKQAKAAFKSRGGPSLSEREQKQLQRAVELEQRAQRAREADKRRAEANKRRLEREKREGEERSRLQLATQRRRDKFGYKCSQMHLGPFFTKKSDTAGKVEHPLPPATDDVSEDSFGDSDLDDETLLQAMEGIMKKQAAATTSTKEATATPPNHQALARVSTTSTHRPVCPARVDFASFLDDLDSNTQIARELADDEPSATARPGSSRVSSFDDDLDLTPEEIEELESRQPQRQATKIDTFLMPPPPRPAMKLQKPISSSIFDHGLTMQDLEEFAVDNIQLTQADPG